MVILVPSHMTSPKDHLPDEDLYVIGCIVSFKDYSKFEFQIYSNFL